MMARIHARSLHFGEASWPADLDSNNPRRPLLEQMLSETCWQ